MTQPDGPKAPLFRDKELRNFPLSWKAKSEKESGALDGDPSLTDLVLSWSVEDILNEKLYADKVKIIPESFHSVEDYVESYIFPLLEETRAELCSSLEAVSDGPLAEITAIKELKHDSKLYYFIDVRGWKSISGFEIYKPSPGDIFILSTIIPKAAEDLLQKGETYRLASVTDVKNLLMDEKESPSSSSLVTVFRSDEEYHKSLIIEVSKGIKAAEGMGSSLYAIFLSSLTTSNRIWNALSFGIDLENKNLNMIKEALHAKPLDKVTCNAYSFDQMVVWATKFYKELIFLKLNESQKDAVLIALSNIRFHLSYSFNLIWSPPGTGKTKTTSVLLWVLLDMGCRTLICAPTNIAVAKLSSCLLSIVKDYRGRDNKSIFPSFSLGDIVLLVNKDQMLIGESFHLQEIFLEHRVERLAECFSTASGWNQILLSLISLLQNCVQMYYSYLEDQEIEADVGLKEFLRKKLDAIIQPLCECMRLLSMHLSSAYISDRVVGNMATLYSLLEDFRSLLCTEDVSDKELEELFSPEGPVGYLLHTSPSPDPCSAFENTTRMSLHKTRSECLRVLRALKDSLHLPLNISKDWIKEFCLKNATLIFCNASTASSLQYYEMEPFEVLVIDDASQLKECETVIPLRVKGIHHAILIGDERQLPSIVKSEVSNAAGFGRSLFERLVLLGNEKHLLDMQSCMHPSISTFPNAKFYDGLLVDGPNVRHETYERHYLQGPMYGPYSFINIVDGREEQDEINNSWKNMVEVAVAMKIIRSLFKSWNGKAESLSVGIMCPYSAQVNAIQMRIANQYKKQNGFTLEVKSIDGFQGCEMDVITLSTVRCNNKGKVGLLRNLNLTNVALTRARHSLWILGNASTLVHSDSVKEEIISDIEKRGLCFNANEDEGLAKAILQVKNEYNQLEDLLKPDSVLLGKARWKVSFSNYFLKSFAMLKYVQTKQVVIKLLLKLAEGWRPKSESLYFPDSCHLVKQCRVSELYLIWTVDIVLDENYIQVLKVWDIVPGTEIPRLVKQLDNIFAMYTDVYIQHCKQRCIEGKLQVPMVWHPGKVINCYKEQCKPEHVENSKIKESLLLMKFYSLSSGVVNHLLSDNEGKEIDLPFELADQENEIVRFPRSAFILGRSGTGKTTVLTMKLIRREQHHLISWNGLYDGKVGFSAPVSEKNELDDDLALNENVLRQVFITVSPKLCAAIRNQIYRLQSFSSGQGSNIGPSSTDMYDSGDSLTEFMDIPNTFIGIPTRQYPLVITLKKFLMMLDGTVSKSYFRNLHSTRKFLTDKGGVSNSLALQAFIQSKEVTYERFAVSYWPHFKARLTKKFDPLTVFTQIISHIKGGPDVNDTMEGKLGREKYIMLSEHRISTLSSEQREWIYEIFLGYEKKKAKNGEFDICDIVNYLHRQLCAEGFVGDNVDFVYIDEVQDLTMRQIALFKYVCKNVQEGFVFAGDTAQTIARGIDFRFEDIKSLFYREFLSELRIQRKVGMKKKDAPLSDIIHLKQNFRTHAGVLKLAQSIVDLLIHFFPLSVDVLSPESSLIYGEAPVILESGNDENDITAIFGSSGSTTGVNWGFGAEQVILVRDDSNKKKILDNFERKALVLTILESKGLEFQDVLLYNFFGPSPLGRHWNLVYEYMNKKNLLDSAFPCFDAAKHCILRSELKQLYVAITRTRQRLWIWESDYELSKPVFDYWKKLDLVQVRRLDSSLAHTMRTESSAEDWRSQGIKLFNDGNFEMATMCFEHAGDEFREKWAKAAAYRSTGERILYTNFEQAQGALQQAAKIYESIGKPEAAASCFIKLKDYKRAGKIYLESSWLKEAGDCFDMARCWVLAANAYAKGIYLSECLSVCTRRRLFGLGLQFIKQWKEDSSLDVVNKSEEVDCLRTKFLESCARSYLELGEAHRILFVGAFNSIDLIRNFLKTRNLINILLEVEMDSGNYLEAASIARTRGDLLREADALEKLGHFRKASKFVILHVVINSLWADGNKGWPLKQFWQKAILLMKAKSLAEKVSNDFYQSICAEVIILSDTDTNLSNLLLHCNDAQRFQNVRLEIFAARKLLDSHLNLDPSEFHRESGTDQDLSNHINKIVSCNCTLVGTLIYSWDLWKERILNVLSYLQLLGKTKLNECSLYADFCTEYFGVRREFNKDTFTVLNSKAYWYKVTNDDSLLQYENMVRMNVPQFASCAKNFFA